MKSKRRINFLKLYLITLLIFAVIGAWFVNWLSPRRVQAGATFSPVYAEHLGLDWREAYLALLDDLQVKKIRLPAYWSEIAVYPDGYDFTDLDWMMDEAAERNVAITLAIGAKVPRWPECHIPSWLVDVSAEAQQAALYDYLRFLIERYREHPALERWQLENEALFPFGHCPLPDLNRLQNEELILRELDPDHQIQKTTSGEQSFWAITAASGADILGVSLYRVTWNNLLGYIVFPHQPVHYALQNSLASLVTDQVIISELQAEPWFSEFMFAWPIEKQYQAFNVADMLENYQFARQTRADEVYFWGAEWWYYLKEQGDSRLWNVARLLIMQGGGTY